MCELYCLPKLRNITASNASNATRRTEPNDYRKESPQHEYAVVQIYLEALQGQNKVSRTPSKQEVILRLVGGRDRQIGVVVIDILLKIYRTHSDQLLPI